MGSDADRAGLRVMIGECPRRFLGRTTTGGGSASHICEFRFGRGLVVAGREEPTGWDCK